MVFLLFSCSGICQLTGLVAHKSLTTTFTGVVEQGTEKEVEMPHFLQRLIQLCSTLVSHSKQYTPDLS